jgi:hemerythrin
MTADVTIEDDADTRAAGDPRQDDDVNGTSGPVPSLASPQHEPPDPGTSLLALEVDQYALIVHLHGPEAADVIARHLGAAIRSTLGHQQRSLRSGPGQYAVLLPGGPEAAEDFARAAATAFGQQSWPDLGEVTVSAGGALRYADETIVAWWTRVEATLAQARAAGGGRVVVDRRRCAGDATAAASGPYLRWQTRFDCGEPTIDRQHRQLFEHAEEVLELLRQGSPRVAGELERLVAEILRHFADEERVLEQRAYAGLAAHRRSHADLAARAQALQSAVAAGRATHEELTRFLLGEVVADHMLTEDQRFADLFAPSPAR